MRLRINEQHASSGETLGARLKFFRDGLFLRQSEMAQYLGVSMSLYTKLESDRMKTSIRTLARFAEKLNTTVEFLRDGKGAAQLALPSHSSASLPTSINNISDELMQKIIGYALDPTYQKLADNIVCTLNLTKVRAMAMIIRTMLSDLQTMHAIETKNKQENNAALEQSEEQK